MSIEAMKQALQALESAIDQLAKPYSTQAQYAITSLRQAIEQAEKQAPVALQMDVIVVNLVREGINKHRARELAEHFIKHTAPQPQREWVGLTDEELEKVFPAIATYHESNKTLYRSIARAIETKLKELNT